MTSFGELAEMDFADYGDFATFVRIRGNFHVSRLLLLWGGTKKEGRVAEMVLANVMPNWLAVFGAPRIIVVDKDSRFIGGILQEFRTARNIVSQAEIPRHRQSLGRQNVGAGISE